jgi:general nucleoside transport system permease protein
METIVQTSLVVGIPLLLAALAGIISERTGLLNVGLEGFMLSGAFSAAWAGSASTNIVGFLAAIGLGFVIGLALAYVMVVLRGDQVVVGIVFNILVLGVTSYLFAIISSSAVGGLQTGGKREFAVPGLADIPWLGEFFQVHWIGYMTYVLVPLIFFLLFKTGLGVRMRACGEFAEGARAVGVSVVRVRVLATAVGGLLAAAAGAYMVLGDVGVFRQNMTAGRGYLALAIVILGRWNPFGALAAAALFAVAQALTFYFQVRGIGVPVEAVLAMPYIVALVAITLFGKRVRPPAEDGRPLHLPT